MTAIAPDNLTETLKAILARLDKVEDSLNNLRMDVAKMDGRLSQMPTLIQLIGIMFAIMAGTFGILAAAKLWL